MRRKRWSTMISLHCICSNFVGGNVVKVRLSHPVGTLGLVIMARGSGACACSASETGGFLEMT